MRNKAIPFTLEVPITAIKKVNNRFTNIPTGKLEVWGKGVVTVDHLADPELTPGMTASVTVQSIMCENVDILPVLLMPGCSGFLEAITLLSKQHCISVHQNLNQ